jgi:hypothetical protein
MLEAYTVISGLRPTHDSFHVKRRGNSKLRMTLTMSNRGTPVMKDGVVDILPVTQTINLTPPANTTIVYVKLIGDIPWWATHGAINHAKNK